MATVTIREHVVSKTDEYGLTVEKSLNQDFVFVNDKLAGYLSHVSKKFMPIVGWNNAHNDMVCRALEGLKPEFGPISHIDAPPLELLAAAEDDE